MLLDILHRGSYFLHCKIPSEYFLNWENKIQFCQLSSSLCCTFIDNTATKSDIAHLKAVQQTVLDNQQVLLQSLHENQTNIVRLGKLYFNYYQK